MKSSSRQRKSSNPTTSVPGRIIVILTMIGSACNQRSGFDTRESTNRDFQDSQPTVDVSLDQTAHGRVDNRLAEIPARKIQLPSERAIEVAREYLRGVGDDISSYEFTAYQNGPDLWAIWCGPDIVDADQTIIVEHDTVIEVLTSEAVIPWQSPPTK